MILTLQENDERDLDLQVRHQTPDGTVHFRVTDLVHS